MQTLGKTGGKARSRTKMEKFGNSSLRNLNEKSSEKKQATGLKSLLLSLLPLAFFGILAVTALWLIHFDLIL